jgi:hypothetical protein
MSFRCGECDKRVDAGVKPVRKVTKIRDKNYLGGGQGWEIAQEKRLCVPCSARQGPPVKVL